MAQMSPPSIDGARARLKLDGASLKSGMDALKTGNVCFVAETCLGHKDMYDEHAAQIVECSAEMVEINKAEDIEGGVVTAKEA